MQCPVCLGPLAPPIDWLVVLPAFDVIALTLDHADGRRCELRASDPRYQQFIAQYLHGEIG